jgi:hypothetical protein
LQEICAGQESRPDQDRVAAATKFDGQCIHGVEWPRG